MKFNVRYYLAAALALVGVGSAQAEIKLPKLFGDHMVLQRETEANLWGWAAPGEEVKVSLGEATVTTKADDSGKWKTKIKTGAAGGPHELKFKGSNEVTLKDVYLGEVWIASGQSNMEWTVSSSLNPQEEAANAKHPLIRMIKVQRIPAEKPVDDIPVDPGTKKTTPTSGWAVCSPETAPSFSAVGYYFARYLNQELAGVPVGIVNDNWGGTVCEAWTSNEALAAVPSLKYLADRKIENLPERPDPKDPTKKLPPKFDANQPAVLFNGMLAPVIPLSIRGAIWYQGESNVGRAHEYATLFPTMIADWRARFGQGDFPFLFVQLAPYRYNSSPRLAELWDAQNKTLATSPNTGMCVTTDITTIGDIHPKNKQDVGKRLALWALANTYGKKDLVYSGPLYDSSEVEGNKIRVKFKHGAGLTAKDDKPLTYFQIAGEDEKFVDAKATIDGETIVVTSEEVQKPVAVRFAWNELAEPNLFNKAGLPASPFRTDSFKLLTGPK
ncbi:sialate O-acetylesterase [Anatilimnocola floriformis]|uniref:sialate O-acetylesterase n=1 Tax=Anatilimnocola floriformis TaxID=2948575 RepID=UPI0020C22EDC|nr:sialate O-acetylesterase [Anatilimnocola floriformis]